MIEMSNLIKIVAELITDVKTMSVVVLDKEIFNFWGSLTQI